MSTFKFTSRQNPSRETILAVDATALSLLPTNYSGTSENKDLTALFVKTLQKVGSYKELNTINLDSIPEDMAKGNALCFATNYLRFIRNGTDFNIYYDFQRIFKASKLSDNVIYYTLQLLDHYGENARFSVFNIVNTILSENPEPVTTLPSIDKLDNFFNLAKVLRKEGVQIIPASLWLCSTHWNVEEVITMISEGLPVQKAVELYNMGFETMDEIIEYGNDIPSSWLDRIINGAPKSEKQFN